MMEHAHGYRLVHRALRHDLASLVQQSARLDLDSDESLHSLARRLAFVWGVAQRHHEFEDTILFPALSLRQSTFDPGLFVEQHEQLEESVAEGREAVRAVLAAGSDASRGRARDRMQQAVLELHNATVAHLDDEEDACLPIIRNRFTPREFARLEHDLAAHMSVRQLSAFVPWLLQWASPEEKQRFLLQSPWTVRLAAKLGFAAGPSKPIV